MEYTAGGQNAKALQQVVFVVQFARAFSDVEFAKIDEASREWRNDLPRQSVSNAVLIQPETAQVAIERGKITTLSFEAIMKDGSVEFCLKFEGNRILFLDGKNSRWAEFWPKAGLHLANAISLVSQDNNIVSYAAEYLYLFRGKGEYKEYNVANILKSSSRLIPKHIFNRSENFHFHTGYFETIDQPIGHRILSRTNVDLRDNDQNRTRDLSIEIFHSILPFSEPWERSTTLPKQILDRKFKNFEILHDLDKKVLLEILNNDMSQNIGLLK